MSQLLDNWRVLDGLGTRLSERGLPVWRLLLWFRVVGDGSQMESGTWIEHYVGASGGMIVGFGQSGEGNLVVFHWMGDSVVIS